jgi:hypothetical protein
MAARLAWWLICLGLGLALVHLAVSVAGAVATAIFVTMVLVFGGIGAWAEYVEPRMFGPSAPAAPVEFVVAVDRQVAGELDHKAFAEALWSVADAYIDLCKDRAGVVDEDGFL